ncbi:hypothetical protein [Sulfitobacter sp. S190]|uniref:hypothetical protein n=1 Tax=Sulfitobacter sp. S190 TaxID=2867022 RepID=UPI0021A947AD|nr:hypothetical protein [Sulfitobacter sp. S190]UWR21838.1 hypothetical protein K3756_14260 [Sulfitobacter sp. S190]
MLRILKAVFVVGLLALSQSAGAETITTRTGEDTFINGAHVDQTISEAGDTFVGARSARIAGTSQGDLHVSGFDVTVTADASEDLYVMAATATVRGNVGEDLSVMGYSVRTEASSETKGNVRLLGSSVTVDGSAGGALTVTGRNVILNASIAGDVRILAQTLSFGPDAVVAGTLTYSTPDEVRVPQSVAADDRVFFEQVSSERVWEEWEVIGEEMPALPTFASMFFGFIVSLLFFVALMAVLLSFMPARIAAMRRATAKAPGQTLLLGVLGLSVLIGMVPITALTIVGLPFTPIAILTIVAAWTLGYALGAYNVAMRVWTGFGGDDDPVALMRLLIFAGAIACIALLNFIPFVGWVANYTLVLLGIGAMTRAVFQSFITTPDAVLDVDMTPIRD